MYIIVEGKKEKRTKRKHQIYITNFILFKFNRIYYTYF